MTFKRSTQEPSGFISHRIGDNVLLIPYRVADDIRREAEQELPKPEGTELQATEHSAPERAEPPPHESTGADAVSAKDSFRFPSWDRAYAVYNQDELHALKERQKYLRDEEEKGRLRKLYTELHAAGTTRRIAKPHDVKQAIAELQQAHPNYMEPVRLIEQALELASVTRKAPRIPPMLLVGEPGIGKTHFANEAARLLSTTIGIVNIDTGATHSELLGLDRMWSNSKHGLLFELICLGEYCNPVVILDELDKPVRTGYDDPLAPLHTLLEPRTASKARDRSVEFTFDTSLVTWIATANSLLTIPASLRSRFRTFRIEFPTAEHALQIARKVATDALLASAPPGFTPLSPQIAFELVHLPARQIRQAVAQGVAAAVAAGRTALALADLPREFLWNVNPDSTWLH